MKAFDIVALALTESNSLIDFDKLDRKDFSRIDWVGEFVIEDGATIIQDDQGVKTFPINLVSFTFLNYFN